MPGGRVTRFRSIDLHSHVLPGLDDGVATLAEGVALARALAASGATIVAATPHVSRRYPNTPERIAEAFAGVTEALAAVELPLELLSGAEVSFEQLERLDRDDLTALTFGRSGRCLLLEFPYDQWPDSLPQRLAALVAEGVTPLLAHPERNAVVQRAPQRLAGIVEGGALVQVNAGSVTGAFGVAAAAAARSLLDSGLAHVIASDSHHPHDRPTVAAAAAQLPEQLARWLALDVPGALVRGVQPAPRPPARPRRRFGLLGHR